MGREAKENLVIVHSFPTNSNILGGFYEYLGNFFNVHPVDLPGFTPQTPPLPEVSLTAYARFVQNSIDGMPLDHFLVGGVSFGFAVANLAKPDSRWRGMLAIEPYLNAQSLNLDAKKRLIYQNLLGMAQTGRIGEKLWGSPFLNKLIGRLIDYPAERVSVITDQVDGRTFFKTAAEILTYQKTPHFHDLPYALITNPSDSTVNPRQLTDAFQKGAKNLHLVHTRVDHYPREMTPDYFNERVDRSDVVKMLAWFKSQAA